MASALRRGKLALAAAGSLGIAAILVITGSAGAAGGGNGDAAALSRKPIVFSLPEKMQKAWVEGNISFSPGSLPDPGQLRLADRNGREVPAWKAVKGTWHDGSVMLLRIGFSGTREQERAIWVEWGPGIGGAQAEKAGTAAGVTFNVVDEAGDMSVKGEVDVGTLVVRVEKHAGLYYYWYLAPLGAMLGWLIYRKIRLRRKRLA